MPSVLLNPQVQPPTLFPVIYYLINDCVFVSSIKPIVWEPLCCVPRTPLCGNTKKQQPALIKPICVITHQLLFWYLFVKSHKRKKGPSRVFFIRLLLNVARPSDTSRQLLTLNFEIWSLTKDQLSDCSIDRRLGEQFTSPVLIFCKSSYSLFTRNEEYCSAFLMDALYGACSGGG